MDKAAEVNLPTAIPTGDSFKEDDLERHTSTGESGSKELSSLNNTIEAEKSIGVRKAEILAAQYTKWYQKLFLLFAAFLVGYAYGLDGQTRFVFTAIATGSYSEHSLLTTVGVITGVAGAASQPVFARLSDVFGRLEIFIVSILFYIVGTVIESQADTVDKYAGGAVLYLIGYSGVILVLIFILADFSTLKWRLFYTLVPTLPYIINTWISGNVTGAVGLNWSWGVGMWAFILPLASLPLLGCMIHMRWLASKTPEWAEFKQRKTKFQELGFVKFMNHLFWTLDVIGLLLLIVLLGCILVPLTIAGGVKTSWQTGKIIAPMVIGVILLPVFVVWEKYNKDAIAPIHLLKDRGIWSALLISFFLNFIFAIEGSFLYTVLVVAVNQTAASATRIASLSSFVSVVGGFFFGLFVVKFRRLKGFIVFGCCMWMVAFGIMIHFRGNLASFSGFIGGQVLMGFGTSFFSYPVSVSMQSCTNHEHMAVIISLGFTVYRIGYSAGSAIAGAIWTQLLYGKLLKQIDDVALATAAYSSPFTFILLHPWGTPVRDQVVHAYRDIQKILMIVSLIFCIPMIAAGLFLRDNKLGDIQSEEGIEKKELEERFVDYVRRSLNFRKAKQEELTLSIEQ